MLLTSSFMGQVQPPAHWSPLLMTSYIIRSPDLDPEVLLRPLFRGIDRLSLGKRCSSASGLTGGDEDLIPLRLRLRAHANRMVDRLEQAIAVLASKLHPISRLHLRISCLGRHLLADEDGAAVLSAFLPLRGRISKLVLTGIFHPCQICERYILQIRALCLHTLVVRPDDMAVCAWAKIGSISGLSTLILECESKYGITQRLNCFETL